jgi:DNA-3-methyladenine glycosylase II
MAIIESLPCFQHLSRDKKLLAVMQQTTPYLLKKKKNVCLRLCASIMSQQLSVKVAEVFYRRFLALYDGVEPTPQQIADTPFDMLRGIGLSNAKANYVLNVAAHFLNNGLNDRMLQRMNHDEVMELLLPIKGVGKWTIEMLLMFSLGHEDVFPADDLGIQQSMAAIYKLDSSDKKKLKERMLQIAAAWSPYRTYACFYLWPYKDGKKA